ncbi:hypothetical protein N185_16155 [Sinorhizobium sp. GW3]|nr:hypothetical protein N185_16155 [Sinorhizobium sp. GW3]
MRALAIGAKTGALRVNGAAHPIAELDPVDAIFVRDELNAGKQVGRRMSLTLRS